MVEEMRADEVKEIPVQYNYSQRVEDWATRKGIYERIKEAQRTGNTNILLHCDDIPFEYKRCAFASKGSWVIEPKEIKEHFQSLGYTVGDEMGYEWWGFRIRWNK
jgi:hypothetical protein